MDFVNKILQGNCVDVLKTLPSESIQMCVTSPPYYGLRSYLPDTVTPRKDCPRWAIGKLGEISVFPIKNDNNLHIILYKKSNIPFELQQYFEPAEIGMEETPEIYISKLVDVFREVKRVLRKDGTLWVNIGDSYSGSGRHAGALSGIQKGNMGTQLFEDGKNPLSGFVPIGTKPKDLIGIPWMLAFALRADGWYLRQDIIWAKKNCMPESVTDRCTKSHEYIFLLSKSDQYFYDYQAILEPAAYDGRKDTTLKGNGKYFNDEYSPVSIQSVSRGGRERWPNKMDKYEGTEYAGGGTSIPGHSGYFKEDGEPLCHVTDDGILARNKRDVWFVGTKPYKEAHFAVYPLELISPCILAGCPEFVCPKCGEIKRKIVSKGEFVHTGGKRKKQTPGLSDEQKNEGTGYHTKIVSGFTDCGCGEKLIPGVVLDPFMGSGTTAVASLKYKRNYVGIELNPEYIEIAEKRIEDFKEEISTPLFDLAGIQ